MTICQNTLQSYAQSLLTLMGNQTNEDTCSPLLGMALRWDTRTSRLRWDTRASRFNLPAYRLLKALIEHAPFPQTVAQQFMTQLEKCENAAVINLGAHALSTYVILFILIIMCKSGL